MGYAVGRVGQERDARHDDGRAARRDLLIIHNPAAGRRRESLYRATLAALERWGCRLEIRPTTGPGDAEAFAREARDGSFDAVVAAGGDGTINEVINGLAGSAMPLGFISLGTANVFAAEIGLAVNPDAMAAALAEGPAVPAHVGRANGRAFGLMAGVGHDAHVVRDVDLALKRRIGKGAYVWQAVLEIFRREPVLFDAVVDGVGHRAASIVVANGRHYGGRFVVAPDAGIETPSFEVCLAERTGRWATFRYAAALVLGMLPRLRDYRIVTARHVEIAAPAGEPVQGDGDDLTRLPVTIALDPTPLSLIRPAPAAG